MKEPLPPEVLAAFEKLPELDLSTAEGLRVFALYLALKLVACPAQSAKRLNESAPSAPAAPEEDWW